MTKKKQQSTTTDADRRLNQADRLGKILRILQLIQSRGRWNVAEIAREIEVVERTIYRYFNILELAGVPYYYDRRARSYRVRPGWFFPVLNLSGEELVDQAVATAVASVPGVQASRGATSTTRKIAETDEVKQELLADAEMLIQVLDLKLSDHSRHGQVIRTAQRALLEVTGNDRGGRRFILRQLLETDSDYCFSNSWLVQTDNLYWWRKPQN